MKFDTYEDYPVTASTFKITGVSQANSPEYGPDKLVRGKFITNSRGIDTVLLTPTETQLEPGKVIGDIKDANGVELEPDTYFEIRSRAPIANVYGIAEGVKHVLKIKNDFRAREEYR